MKNNVRYNQKEEEKKQQTVSVEPVQNINLNTDGTDALGQARQSIPDMITENVNENKTPANQS